MKTDVARLRVSDPEKDILRCRAEAMGLTISDYMRYCCLINPPTSRSNGGQTMKYIDSQHEQFYKSRVCGDTYRDSVSYLLGLTAETRAGATDLFDEDGMRIDGLSAAWQTGTTMRLTRLAFNLWNDCMVESEEDYEAGRYSKRYGPSEIFCCNLAPYFVQAIRIRYPDYFR